MKYHRRAIHPNLGPIDRRAIRAAIRDIRVAEYDARFPVPQDEQGWPHCRHCRQSCTGSYLKRPHCVRCDTYHRLTADAA